MTASAPLRWLLLAATLVPAAAQAQPPGEGAPEGGAPAPQIAADEARPEGGEEGGQEASQEGGPEGSQEGSQEGGQEGRQEGVPEAPEEGPAAAEAPALPPPTLPDPAPVGPPAPAPEEPADPEAEGPVILHHIGTGDHPEWEDAAEAERDVAFEVPAGERAAAGEPSLEGGPRTQLEGADPETPAPPFGIALSVGFARLLADQALDFVRLEERFEWRLPDFPALRIGLGASQMVSDTGFLVGGGPRLGFGAFFCDAGWVQCEGVASVQPGVMGGEAVGVRFDLNASLDLRFLVEGWLELSVGGGYSLLGEISLVHLTGQAGLVF